MTEDELGLRCDSDVVLVREVVGTAHSGEEEAMAIMRDCGASNVHVHEVRMKRFEDAPL